MLGIIDGLRDTFSIITGNVSFGALIVLILAKVIPNRKLYKFFDGIGSAITLGMSKFGWYQKVEDWFINGLDVSVQGFIHGLRHDNSPENKRNRDIETE